jgi:hypothetical protein
MVTSTKGLEPEKDYAGEASSISKDKPVLSSERVPHVKKPATI